MKKLTSLLIGCSLALAGAALAQQPVEQESPSKGKRAPEKARTTEAKPGVNAAKPETPAAKQPGAMKERGPTTERGATTEPGAGKGRKTPTSQESATTPKTNVSGQPTGAATRVGRTRNLQLPPRRERVFPVNRPVRRRPVPSSRLNSGGKG